MWVHECHILVMPRKQCDVLCAKGWQKWTWEFRIFPHLFETGSQVFTGYPLTYSIVRDDLEVVILFTILLELNPEPLSECFQLSPIPSALHDSARRFWFWGLWNIFTEKARPHSCCQRLKCQVVDLKNVLMSFSYWSKSKMFNFKRTKWFWLYLFGGCSVLL